MKSFLIFCSAIIFVLHVPSAYTEDSKPSADQIAAWVKQLADDDFAVRNAAEVNLVKAGAAAEKALTAAKESKDVEVRMRVSRLLGGIKIEQMLKAAETAMSKATGIEGEMIVVLDELTVRAHVKSLPDGKHFVIDETMQRGNFKNTMRIVGDGETVWGDMVDQSVAPGQKRVIQKHAIASIEKRNGEPIRNPLDQAGDVRLFVYNEPTEMKLGDEDVFVLEGTLKKGVTKEQRPGSFVAWIVKSDSTARLYFLKSNMMLRKMEIDTGETRLLLEVYNVRFDKSLDSKLFEFTPPADTEVIDLGESAKKGTRVFDGWALPHSRINR